MHRAALPVCIGAALALSLGAPAGVGQALSPALAQYVDEWTGGVRHSATVVCAARHIRPDSPIMSAVSMRLPGQTSVAFILRALLETHPEISQFTSCLVDAGAVSEELFDKAGGALLFAAATPRLFAAGSVSTGALHPGALFESLVSRNVARNYTLGSRGTPLSPHHASGLDPDGFNVLHKVLSFDKRTPDEVADVLLQSELPTGYASHLLALADSIATSEAPAPAIEASRAAVASLLGSRLVYGGEPRRLLGRSMSFAPIRALSNAASLHLIATLASFHAHPGQPSLAALASQRDKFGRTPLHMAALQDNAFAVTAIVQALATVSPAAARVIHFRDAAGYTAADLATSLGHQSAAQVLSEAAAATTPDVWDAPADSRPRGSILPRHLAPVYPTEGGKAAGTAPATTDNGGWESPLLTSPAARATLHAAAVAVAGLGAGRGCDFDIVDVTNFTAALFVREYALPTRPVLVRGLASRESLSWQREALLAAHGDAPVTPAGIPYAASFGGSTGAQTTLRSFVDRLLFCRHAAGDDHGDSGGAESCAMFTGGLDADGGRAPTVASDSATVNSAAVEADGSAHSSSDPLKAQAGLEHPTPQVRYTDPPPPPPPYVFNRLDADSPNAAERKLVSAMNLAPAYLTEASLPTWSGSDAPLLPKGLPRGTLSPELYVGGPGSGAPMHFHGDALNSLMFGRKAWFLEPPAAAEYSTVSAADYVALLLPGHIAGGGAAPLQCTQVAGDVIYVPRGWGHAVVNLETSVGYVVEFMSALRRY
jgi:hypothetical protein